MTPTQAQREAAAEAAFVAQERVRILEMQNMPTDYEGRKKAFVELAKARVAAAEAQSALTAAADGPTQAQIEAAARAMMADLVKPKGAHGCLLKFVPTHPDNVCVDGHLDFESMAKAALTAAADPAMHDGWAGEANQKRYAMHDGWAGEVGGFCRYCGASIPHRGGEGRCPKCAHHADPALRDFTQDTPISEPNDGWAKEGCAQGHGNTICVLCHAEVGEPSDEQIAAVAKAIKEVRQYVSKRVGLGKRKLSASEANGLQAFYTSFVTTTRNAELAEQNKVLRKELVATIERCAQVAEEFDNSTGTVIAARIRALKEKP